VNTFPLIISTPDGNKFKDSAVKIIVRGIEGELAVMAGHIPFITSVKPCECKIELEDGTEKIGHTEGGILTVSKENVTLLCGKFDW
jgi:F-type H+-transporting ATPase subunit epsilon